ncbi:MAG: hypothetical protein IPH54_07495 [Rhodoferax sp.]|nr:hypothetical protein [Rhodoferax sp.]
MKHGLGLNKILGTIHTYPTLAEANNMPPGNGSEPMRPTKCWPGWGAFIRGCGAERHTCWDRLQGVSRSM